MLGQGHLDDSPSRPLTKTPGGAKATLLLLLLEGGSFPRGLPAFLLAHGAISLRTTARKGGVTLSCANERSEEHTSELQSLAYLVCRLLLEKKKTRTAD